MKSLVRFLVVLAALAVPAIAYGQNTGVLRVTVGLREAARPQRINVQ